MQNLNQTIRCLCGKLYEFYSHYCGDQSCCPDCRQKAKLELTKTWGKEIGNKK